MRGPNSHQMELECLMALLQKQQRCRIFQHGLLLRMTAARIGVLARNVDAPGPFRQGHDQSPSTGPRYFVVGVYTIPVHQGSPLVQRLHELGAVKEGRAEVPSCEHNGNTVEESSCQ